MDGKSKEQQATETLQRRLRVMEGYLSGKSQYELARIEEVSQTTISKDLAWVRKQWLMSTLIDVDEAKARELARIDKMEGEYWEEWHRSKQPFTKTRNLKVAKSKPSRRKPKLDAFGNEIADNEQEISAEEFTETEMREGNPVFMDGIFKCVELRCKILGLYAPTKQEVTGKDGGPIETKANGAALPLAYYEMPQDEAARVAAILAEVKAVSEASDQTSD